MPNYNMPKGVTPPWLEAWAGKKPPKPPQPVDMQDGAGVVEVKLPYKVVGGWIRQKMRAAECGCGCGNWIKRGEAYIAVSHEAGGPRRSEHRLSSNKPLRLECWKRRLDARDPAKRIIARDPTRRVRPKSSRPRDVIEGVPAQVVLHLNIERAERLREIMQWAGHDRTQAILYNMIDASWERWRRRRDEGTLPKRPPPLPPKHYGPHRLKVEGFE